MSDMKPFQRSMKTNRATILPSLILLFFYIILLSCNDEVNACLCVEKPLHESYCDSDFVILAKVVTKLRVIPTKRHLFEFQVETRKLFRQKKSLFKVGDIKTIYTPRSSDLCHARVQQHGFYLLGGSQKRNQLFVTSCGLISSWASIPRVSRKLIRKGRVSCECAIRGCNNEKCVKRKGSPKSKSCDFSSKIMKQCYSTYGMCSLQGKNCRWSKKSRQSVRQCLHHTNSSFSSSSINSQFP